MIDTMQGSARTAVAGMSAAVNQVDGGVALAEQAGGQSTRSGKVRVR